MGGICDSVVQSLLSPERICENINRFFTGLAIKALGIDQLKSSVINFLRQGNALSVDSWRNFLDQQINNTTYGRTSKMVVNAAFENARQNYNDQTLPLLTTLFLADSDRNRFIDVFKSVNLAMHAKDAGAGAVNAINQIKSGNILGGIMGGINSLGQARNVAQQASDPNMIPLNDLKRLCSYHLNFITLLPVDLLEQSQEGSNAVGYIANVLRTAFGREKQDQYLNNTLFANYNGQDRVNVTDFFNQNYQNLKNDNDLRIGLVRNYINNLSPMDIRQIIASRTGKPTW
jgi:hypothetical protein